MMIVLKLVVLGFPCVLVLESFPTYSKVVWVMGIRASSHLELKVRTFFNSPGSIDFENDLIFNPSSNIRWEKAKTVCELYKKSACRVNKKKDIFKIYISGAVEFRYTLWLLPNLFW